MKRVSEVQAKISLRKANEERQRRYLFDRI